MGSVVVSVDAELGWGFHDGDPPAARVESARGGWRTLADLFDEFSVPATWAVVGHIMLEDCDGLHEGHPAGPEWFERECQEWASRPDLRFGPDLVSEVQAADVDHEIASHTFSHVLFGSDTSERLARAELELSREAAEPFDVDLRSFVFPRNSVGHRELLAEYGFQSYRGVGPPGPNRLEKLAAATVGEPHPQLVTPELDEHGLVDVPASLYLFCFEGAARRAVATVFEDPVVQRAREGIDAACREDGVFHLWLHPNNLVGPPDITRIRSILSYLDERRDEVAVETMGQVATRVLGDDTDRARPEDRVVQE